MKNLTKNLVLLLLALFICQEVEAQTNLSVQGVIRKSDGNAIEDGQYAITFKLYDTIVGGDLLWTELQPNIQVTSGIYSAILGDVTPLDLPFDELYHLSLTVEGEELLPRAPLTSAPYANAMIGTDNVFPSTGNVGIGTLDPTAALEVNGTTMINADLHVDAVYSTYRGTSTFEGSAGTYTETWTTPTMPSSMVGGSKAVVLIVPSDNAGARVIFAQVWSTTQIRFTFEKLDDQAIRFNWIIFPI